MNDVQTRLYGSLPVWLQNLAITSYGYRLRRREYDREYDRLLIEFEKQQWYTKSELEAYQNDRLCAIVKHAYETVPFYRRHFAENGLAPADIRTVGDVVKLPILTSDTLTRNANELISRTAGPRDRIVGHTSGTTGKPRTLLYDRNVCRVKNAVDYRFKHAAEVKMGDPIACFMSKSGVPIEQKRPPFWRENHALNQRLFSVFHFTPPRYDAYIDALEEFGALAMDGYPSSVSMFAEAMESRGRTHPLKAAFVTSETAVPHQRRVIERAFECEVFDYYGMAERAVFASECEQHRGLHVNSDFGLCEILDEQGQAVSKGESGRIVVTGWHNWTMPLIRYMTDDRATLSTESCTCGRAFPLLASVDGRESDQIATYDGRYLDITFAYDAMQTIDDKIVGSQLVQEEIGQLTVKIVPKTALTSAEIDLVVGTLRRYMGATADVRLEYCDSLPRSASGKFRWLVSKVPRSIRS